MNVALDFSSMFVSNSSANANCEHVEQVPEDVVENIDDSNWLSKQLADINVQFDASHFANAEVKNAFTACALEVLAK